MSSTAYPQGSRQRSTSGGAGSAAAPAGGAYGLGFIGAAVYYIQVADSFWDGVVGILQALVWPAFLVYHLLDLVGA